MNIINKFTIRTLMKNKIRTLVTIVGIILSVAMISAVTTLISSLQTYLVETTVANDGDWHGVLYSSDSSIDKDVLKELDNNKDVKDYVTGQNIGYSLVEDSINEYKPYLFIFGMGDGFTDTLPVHLIDGRLPETTDEILLPKHLQNNGGVKHDIGDVLNLSLGERSFNGENLKQMNGFIVDDDGGAAEEFIVKEERTYTVVGFYERPSFENFSAPGYTALTLEDVSGDYDFDVYIKLKVPKNIEKFLLHDDYVDYGVSFNSSYLRYINASNNDAYNGMLYGLATILIIIIMLGSISLIYNAFSISVSERTKHFGLISSIGGTKKQILRSVLFEAILLSGIGIPLGILSGITGIGITLSLTKNLFSTLMIGSVSLGLSVSIESIIIATIVGLVTVLISAYIPARRAVKIPAIEAIRQTADINIKGKKVKTSRLTYKIFGFEGMIASKNFKRNKRKYRATVISLFMSIVLFISATSLTAYLARGVGAMVEDRDYDLRYYLYNTMTEEVDDKDSRVTYEILKEIEGVTASSYAHGGFYGGEVKVEDLTPEFTKYYKGDYVDFPFGENLDYHFNLQFVDDDSYQDYLKKNNYDIGKFTDNKNPIGIVFNEMVGFSSEDRRYHEFNLFNKESIFLDLELEKEIEGYRKYGNFYDDEERFFNIYIDELGNELQVPEEDTIEKRQLELIIGSEKDVPIGVVSTHSGSVTIMYPYSAMETLFKGTYDLSEVSMYFMTNNHGQVYDKMYKTLEDMSLPTNRLYNVAESMETERALITIMRVFSYGFIALISLIAAVNVFNTISTNIILRRREFAILESAGMSKKGFHKMMNYECILYGVKGLLYGIPVSILITYFIYRSLSNGLDMKFFIPIGSIVVAVGSVFVVVFSTMLYSMNRIGKENTIDALRNENL